VPPGTNTAVDELMKWSWRLARLFGIEIYIHATFVILLVWVGLRAYLQSGSMGAAIRGIELTLAIFGTVVLHELGHALTARRFGIRTRDITLLPIGGVARLERMPDKPWQELLVAVAGPLVNVAIAALIFAALALTGTPLLPADAAQSSILSSLLWVNVTLAIFNLLPAFPMDGGRVLRALLAMRIDYVRATRAAARTGQGIALLLGIAGLFFNPILVFVALFVWIGAASEAASVQTKAALEGVPVAAAMITDVRTLSPDDTLAAAVEKLLGTAQNDFPVVDPAGRLQGVLVQSRLLEGLSQRGAAAYVGEVMDRRFEVAHPLDLLGQALERLQACDCRSLPVVQDGRLVGLVTVEKIGELLMVKDALLPRVVAPRRDGRVLHGRPQAEIHGAG
jgi:Zn-dependent protease/CBS domain-containing protein